MNFKISSLFAHKSISYREIKMGIVQSKKQSEPYLHLLRQIRLPAYKLAKAKLYDFSRNKSKMSVTKWELLLILQLNTNEVKKIG